jgi:GNAT superfamily N-acetyltransferase
VKGFNAEQASIYRPYPDEIPWALLESAAPDADLTQLDPDLTRIAKHGDALVGVYVLGSAETFTWELRLFAVAAPYRRRGLGRWLVGHAIGLAESRGGRALRVARRPGAAAERLLLRLGFVPDGAGYRFDFVPE